MISVVLVCISIFLCAYAVWAYKVFVKEKHQLPPIYPGLVPFIGHVHLIIGDGVHLWRLLKRIAAECMKRGGVISLLYGANIYYFITDPEDALTAANACLQKHFAYDFGRPWLGDGLITASGDIWQRHRKLLTPAFNLSVTYGFLDIFNSQSRQFVEKIKQEVGKPFDHTVFFRNFNLETFCLTSFGITGIEDKNFVKNYMHAVDNILSIVISRIQNFWLMSDLIFKLSGLQKKQDEFVKTLHDMSDKIIKIKRGRMHNKGVCRTKTTGPRYKPFLDLLLELSEDDALTDKEVREEVDTAIMTGFDTTSALLINLMILLGSHLRVQEEVYQEIKSVFKTDRDVAKEDFQKLVYTDAVIKESLRFITGGPFTVRYVDKDVKLKNYTMRAGSQCLIALFAVNRDPIWGEDVDDFKPERWLNPNLPANPAAFVSFSLGKRSCLGKPYAMTLAKTTLVHFMRRYKITADVSKLQFSCDFLLKPVSGYEIRIEERD